MKEFTYIKSRIGSDSFQKLSILHQGIYAKPEGSAPKSGEGIDATISFCIELAYNTLRTRRSGVLVPECITPPRTKKSQKLYHLYQVVMTLKGMGKNSRQIVSYMNKNGYPTADNLFEKKALVHISPKKWTLADLKYLTNITELNSLIENLNKRKQNKSKN